MTPQFENRYCATDTMVAEYVRRVLCRKIFLLGAFVALAALAALALALWDGERIFATFFGSCLLVVLLTMLLSPPLMLRQIQEQNRNLHNGQTLETVVQFGTRILIREGAFSLACNYDDILKIHQLKHSCVLLFGPRSAVMVSPEHFTIGTYDAFLTFIKYRCSNAV